MNSHSWIELANATDLKQKNLLQRWWDSMSSWRYPILLVVLPTLIVAAYYYLVAADQYESEAHFVVSSNSSHGSSSGSFGLLLGASGSTASQNQASSVRDYLESHEVIAALGKKVDLVAMFSRPEADAFSKLGETSPSPETLLKYYNSIVNVHHDPDTGITTLSVRAFRPSDAYSIASNLLLLSEAQVNRMNQRRYQDAVAAARAQVSAAENRVAQVQGRMTAYRQRSRDIDPEVSGESQIRLVSGLKAQLAMAQASLATMAATINRSSPQYLAMQRQIRSLQSQIGAQSAELTGGAATVASNLGGYEDLRVQQQFAAKNYEAAAASLVKAQEEAARQQLYIVRVVDANMPVKSLFPKRERIVLITFLALCIAYGIGWLILAGVREHAA